MLGTEVEMFLLGHHALFRAVYPMESKGPEKGSAASLEVLTPSPFHI